MARISFSVEGLSAGDTTAAQERADVLHTLAERGFQASFEPGPQIFSVEIDPSLHSFSDIQRAISELGQRRGRLYLAVVMSP